MGLGKFGLGSVVSMMGGNAFNSPAAVFEGIVSISSNVAGSYSMGSVHGNLSTATAGMVKAYTNSDFNAYTSYVNDCYAEVDEPIAELSTLALEVRDLVGVIKIVDRGTPEQKKKVQEENKLLKGLREARLIFLRFYYPGLSPEQLENIAKYYFEPLPEKEPTPAEEAKPKEVVVSSCAVLFGIVNASSEAGMAAFAAALEGIGFGPFNALCLMIFCLLYIPCAAALATIQKESGSWGWTVFTAAFQLAVAWLVTFAVYQTGMLLL